jgi:hypothetical protein
MTPSDDILDLLGRYATGSLTEEERQRLFDAALHDQELFEELAREQELKLLLDQPGAKNRMIRALEPPRRKAGWVFGLAATAAMSVAIMIVLLRPSPKPTPVSVARVEPPAPVVQTAIAPEPVQRESDKGTRRVQALNKMVKSESGRVAPSAKAKATVADQESPSGVPNVAAPKMAASNTAAPNVAAPNVDQPAKDALKKQEIQVQAAPPASQTSQTLEVAQSAQQFTPAQQAVGGPRQIAQQSRAMKTAGLLDRKTSGFGFHYSLAIKGRLIIVPSADGYLFVKSADGTVLFSRKQIAAAIKIDVPLPDAVDSVTITFSATDSQVQTTPIARTESEGVVDGAAQAIQLKIKP